MRKGIEVRRRGRTVVFGARVPSQMDSAKMGELAKGDAVQVLQHGHALDGTARTEVCAVAGARTGWVSTKFLSAVGAVADPGRSTSSAKEAEATDAAHAVAVDAAPAGPLAPLALEPKRNDGLTWNDYAGITKGTREIVVEANVAAVAHVCVDNDWDDGPRAAAKRMSRKELAPLHFEALRICQRAVNGRVLDALASATATCAAAVAPARDATGVRPWEIRAPSADPLVPEETAARLARLLQFVEKRGGYASALDRVPGRVSICVATRKGERRHHRRLYRAFVDCDDRGRKRVFATLATFKPLLSR